MDTFGATTLGKLHISNLVKVEMSVYTYWFFIYNPFHEHLSDNETDSGIIEFTKAEKRFEEGDQATDEKETKTAKSIRKML